jgi:osmotically-inducible protein OsmY
MGSFGCHGAPIPFSAARPDAGAASLTSAVVSSPSDDEIVASLEEAMLNSRVVEPQSGNVHATASGGIVTLRGHVDTTITKQRIHDLAQHTPGVKTVIDELEAPEPNPSAANDAAMTQAIQRHLTARQDDEVRVTTTDATVILEGSVPTEVEKGEIQKLARRTPNVASVDNRILVRPFTKP